MKLSEKSSFHKTNTKHSNLKNDKESNKEDPSFNIRLWTFFSDWYLIIHTVVELKYSTDYSKC